MPHSRLLLLLFFLLNQNLQISADNRCFEALITTALGATFFTTLTSGTCVFYNNPDRATQNMICKTSFILNGISFALILISTCLYCKRENLRKQRAESLLPQ